MIPLIFFDKFPNPLPNFPEWWTNEDEELEDFD